MEPSEGVTWLLQMTREMAKDAEHWQLFAVTWKAMGFEFDDNVMRRLRAHHRMLALFLADVRKQLVPKGTKITAADLAAWTTKFERLQRTHGQLIPLFKRESERFASEFKDAGAAWAPADDDNDER